jgi:hypothetical protein
MKIKITAVFITFIVLVFSASCSPKKLATHVVGQIGIDGMVAVEDEQDVWFARESSPALIKTLEVLRGGNPKDHIILALLSKAYGQYTFGFVEEEMLSAKDDDAYEKARNRANNFYRRGMEFGMLSLSQKSYMKKAFNSSLPDFEKELKKLGKKDIAALFWTAFNWANWLNLNLDDPSAIVDLPRIQAMIKRVLDIDANYNYGTAKTMLAVIEVSRPKMLGGNPQKSLTLFEEAIKAFPDYLMTKVLFAQYYARNVQNKELFTTTLENVESGDTSKIPGQRLSNEMAKRRAAILLKLKQKLF